MPNAARAQDSWSDPPRRPRRQAVDWASPDDLEILGSIGRPREADWTVLTLERDEDAGDAAIIEYPAAAERGRDAGAPVSRVPREVDRVPRESRGARADRELTVVESDAFYDDAAVDLDDRLAPVAPLPERDANGRRTVVIRGQVAERGRPYTSTAQRHRPSRRPSERVGQRPDRVALWAFGLGLLLILVAILSAVGS